MNIHTHSLSTTLYKRNAQQYKGRGNSLQYESARINILYNLHFYNVQVKSWETPNLHLVNFHNFGKLGCLARRHLRTTHQPFVYLVARLCCLPNLGTPPSCHTRVPLPETHFRSQPTTPTSLHAHLHNGRALTQVAKTLTPSLRTNRAPHVHRARITQPSGTPIDAFTQHRVQRFSLVRLAQEWAHVHLRLSSLSLRT